MADQMCLILVFSCTILVFTQLPTLSKAQGVSAGNPECCSTYLMDATGLVAIETQRQLVTTPGTFRALRIRGCTKDAVAVQIWRRVNDNTFQFRWQTEITPAVVEISRNYITVNLGTVPLELSPDDRIGVFSLISSSRLSIPFRLDSTAGLYHSTQRYSDFDGFDSGTQITIDDLRWPRTFNDSIIFCRDAGCEDQPAQSTLSAFTTRASTTTLRPASSSGPCCPTYPLSCDSSDVTNNLSNQTGRVIQLQNTISIITKLINDLFSSRQVTGTCPQGFTPGSIGVGKCYILFRDSVQMALAVLRCRDNFQARLLAIESVEEELFLKSLIGNNSIGTGTENYWTSGMYNRPNGAWYWYDESSRTRTSQVYRNWQGGTIPVPVSDTDVCSTLTLEMSTNKDYWLKQTCTDSKYYICEQPKTCL